MFGSLWPAFPWSGHVIVLAPCVSRKVSSSVLKGRLHSERDTAAGVTGLPPQSSALVAGGWGGIRHRVGACAEQPAAATQEPGGVSFTLFLRGHSLENTRPAGAPQASQLRRNQTKRQPRLPTTHFRPQPHFPVRPPVPVPPLTSGLLRFRSGRLFRPL